MNEELKLIDQDNLNKFFKNYFSLIAKNDEDKKKY
jgi:hypothetical protein